jgi:hypothetical protein
MGMRYEKSQILQNVVFQLVLAAFLLGALLLIDHKRPEYAGMLQDSSQLSSVSIANK